MNEKLIDIIGNEAINRPTEGEEEIWVVYQDNPKYQVSSFGRVKGTTGKILVPITDKNGYKYISMYYPNGVRKNKKVHRLVCEAFWGSPSGNKNITDHIDGCRCNNYYKNLRWVDLSTNRCNRFSKQTELIYKNKTPIVLLDTKTNELIQSFKNINEASKLLKLNAAQIAQNIKGYRKSFSIGYFTTRKNFEENLTKEKNFDTI